MYKNLCITDFFKSFTQPGKNKRPSNDDLSDSPAPKRSRSGTPDDLATVRPERTSQEGCDGTSDPGDAFGLAGEPSVPQNTAVSNSHRSHNEEEPMSPVGIPEAPEGDPLGSQGPVLVSSQRVIVDGEVVIRNSDDESDSEISLDDIDEMLGAGPKTGGVAPPNVSDPSGPFALNPIETKGTVTRSKTRRAASPNAHPLSSTPYAKPMYKFSLASLKQQNKDHEAAEMGNAEAWSLLDSMEGGTSSPMTAQRPTVDAEKIDADLVVSVLKEKRDEEDIGRLMTAIQRTEAFQQGKTWSFFVDMEQEPLSANAPFPHQLETRWNKIISDASTRDQAFVGGFVGEMASKENLPGELILWLLDAVCLESRDDLRHSYADTIKAAQHQITSLLTPSSIGRLFQRIGASIWALDIHKPINPRVKISETSNRPDWSRLVTILDVLGRISNHLTMESRMHTLCLLCRLLLDTSIVRNCEALIAIQDAFENLMTATPDIYGEHEIQQILAIVYPIVEDSTLRLQLLDNVPTSSPRLTAFRRQLALAYFFHDKDYLSKSTSDMLDLRSISKQLQNPCFAIRSDTDYPELAAMIGILSIGIDRGDPPPHSSDKQKKGSFDEDVDLLATRIRHMFTSIIDTGASHIKRTEAKEKLEAFHSKLLYAVRTKPQRKTLIFGDSEASSGMQKKAFRNYFESETDIPT